MMKRSDLTQELLNRVLQDVRHDLELKENEMIQFAGIAHKQPSFKSAPVQSIASVWSYSSTDPALMNTFDSLDDSGNFPNEDVLYICQTLFSPIFRHSMNYSVPVWFWDTPLGFACKVAQARFLIDSFMPLPVMDLAILADKKHTTIQQHAQRGSIAAVKDGRAWVIPPVEALKYLETTATEPFVSHYNILKYKVCLKAFIESESTSIRKSDIEKFYSEYI